ncbi:hypothetical protein [Nevskia sp.]|uniref:DUF6874 family protein n=1 Tax=Nevskia sp. TaxID=1929292 RepID=UPI0025FB5A71|nr:hypothetical protein [Nevskia sp.]
MTLSFACTKDESALIAKAVDRAMKLADEMGLDYPRMDCHMDLTACHANGNPLDFARLVDADDFNFSHDVLGIRRHIDRNTGKLLDCFSPRFSQR